MNIADIVGKKPRSKEELAEHISVANHLRWAHPTVLWTIAPSGFKLPVQVAKQLKLMGYRKGTTDFLIFEPRGLYHGLFLELKTIKGRLKPEQNIFIQEAIKRGYRACEEYGWQDAVRVIDRYLARGV